jgi:PAS domain S-box-containing protein
MMSADLPITLIEGFFTAACQLNKRSGDGAWGGDMASVQVILNYTLSLADTYFGPIDHLAILLKQPDNGYKVSTAWNRYADQAELSASQYALMAGRALSLVAEPLTPDHSENRWFEGRFQACLFVPLLKQQEAVGVIAVGSRERAEFSNDEVRLYTSFAAFVAPLVEKGQLTDEHAPSTLLESLIREAADSVVTLDRSGTIIGFNRAAESLYGYTATQILEHKISSLLPADRQAEVDGWIQRVFLDGCPIKADIEIRHSSGSIVQVYAALSPVKGDDGNVQAVALWAADITERIAHNNAYREERDLMESMLEATNDAVLMVDAQNRIVIANLQFEAFFQLARFQFIDRTVNLLIDQIRQRPDLPGDMSNLLLSLASDNYQTVGGDFEMFSPHERTLQERVLVWYSAPVHGSDGRHLGRLFVFRDATHEREVDRMKTEFVSLVSHELRTPVTSISGFTDLILDGDAGPVSEHILEYLNIVKANADRLINLINDILDITRVEAGHLQLRRAQRQIGDVISRAVKAITPLINEREQTLLVDISEGLPPVWIDSERIAQVITNLLSNAMKFTAQGGKLRVEARLIDEHESPSIPMPTGVFLPSILVGVHDNGIGVASKEQPFLFRRFYRTEEAARNQVAGTGLGLTIVKSLVELHGGHVWFTSELEQGSSFYFTVPIVEGL